MADKTYGFKVNEDVYERARMVIESSGLSSKDWFENALAMYEVKAMQTNSPEYAKDLTELELHTTRIYELVINMIHQSVYLKNYAIKEVADKLESKEGIILELQSKLAEMKEQVNQLTINNKQSSELQATLQEQLNEQKSTIDNGNLLINEYKEKNDTLNGLLTQYKGYAEENEQLKSSFEQEKANFLQQANEQRASAEEKIRDLETLNQTASERVHQLEVVEFNNQ